MNLNTNNNGFSMFAILVVASIIGIIATVGFVALSKPGPYGLNPNSVPRANYTPAPVVDLVQRSPVPSTEASTSALEAELNAIVVSSPDAEFTELNASASSL